MKAVSAIAEKVRPSTTMAIDAMAKQMKADGVDIIGFGAGEPDFNTPENIKDAAIAAIHDNFTRYTPSNGIEPLRSAICRRLEADCGVSYRPEEIVVSSGAKHNVYIALCVLLNPGDEVILPAPYWISYYEMIRMAGGVPVVVDAPEEDGFKLNLSRLRAAVTPKTKAMILNNPSNPTGMVYTKDELLAIGNLCVEQEIYLIADEIYYSLVYGGAEFVSVPSLSPEIKEITILINGVSKSYAMTGWRIGYAAASPRLAKLMSNYQSHSTSSPSSISQKAALEAVSGPQDSVEKMRKAFEERRDYLVSRINAIEGVSCLKPSGAFYVMMNIEKLLGKTLGGQVISSADDFASAFLKSGLVAVVPCEGFGAPHFVRWSYATSMENIRKGMDRLEAFLKG